MPTGKEWDAHFKRLKPTKKKRLVNALNTLLTDSMFGRYYGSEFRELASLIKHPLRIR